MAAGACPVETFALFERDSREVLMQPFSQIDDGLSAEALLNFVGALYLAHTWNATEPGHNSLQVVHIVGFDDKVHSRLGGAGEFGIHAANICAVVADDRGQLLEHACPIIAVDGQLDRIGGLSASGLRRRRLPHSTEIRRSLS